MRKQLLIGWIVVLALLVLPVGSAAAAEERIAKSPDSIGVVVARTIAFFERLADRFDVGRSGPEIRRAPQPSASGLGPLPPPPPPPPPPEVGEEEGEATPVWDPNG